MICVTILYFAHLRDLRGCSSEQLTLSEACTIGALFRQLFSVDPTGIRLALDAEYVDAETMISDGDEIAFLPPMGGG